MLTAEKVIIILNIFTALSLVIHYYYLVVSSCSIHYLLVDGRGRFIWASCGQLCNCHDSTLLQSTELRQRLSTVCHLKTAMIGNITVPALVLDGAFPFPTFMMKRFSNAVLTREQTCFNKRLSSARMNGENTFGILKARFRVLSRKCGSSPANLKMKTLACVVLHNMLNEMEQPTSVDSNAGIGLVRRASVGQDNAAARAE